MKHWGFLSSFLFILLCLLVSISLTVFHIFAAWLYVFRVGRINPGTFGTAFTSLYSGHSGSSMLWTCSISDSTSAVQLSSLSFGLSKSPFQWSQSSVSKMLSGAQFSSLASGWQLIYQIRRTFNTWVCFPARSCAPKGDGKGDHSDNVNAAAPS